MTAKDLGGGLERQRAGGINNEFLIDLDARNTGRLGARGDDHCLRLQHLFGAIGGSDRHPAGTVQATHALDPVDLVFLEEEFNALGQASDTVALLRLHLGEVEPDLSSNAKTGKVFAGNFIKLGGM